MHIFLFFLLVFIYLKLLAPTVVLHDSGELISCAYLLGITHPPGYPLYCLLSKIFITLIPVGNIAYKLNILSCLFATLASLNIFFIIKYLTKNTLSSVVGSVMFGLSSSVLRQALIAEKYTLTAFFLSLLCLVFLFYLEKRKQKILYIYVFLLGLSFAHHLQTFFILPASFLFLLSVTIIQFIKLNNIYNIYKKAKLSLLLRIKFFLKKVLFIPKQILIFLILFILPLLVYSYLYINSARGVELNWGSPNTYQRFKDHITARDYQFYPCSLAEIPHRLKENMKKSFPDQFSYPMCIIGIIGIISLLLRWKFFFFFSASIAIFSIAYWLTRYIYNIEDYYIPSNIFFSIAIGVGIWVIINKIKKLKKYHFIYSPTLGLFFVLIFLFLYFNSYKLNKKNYFFVYDYGRNIINHIKHDGIIFFTRGDNHVFPTWYLYYVENYRKDIVIVNQPFILYDWYIEELGRKYDGVNFKVSSIDEIIEKIKVADVEKIKTERLIELFKNNKQRKSYVLFDERLQQDYCHLVPVGVFSQLEERPTKEEKIFNLRTTKLNFIIRGDIKSVDPFTKRKTIDNYTNAYFLRGIEYFNLGLYEEAYKEFKEALKFMPPKNIAISLYTNIASCLINLGRQKEAKEVIEEILKLDQYNKEARELYQFIKNKE